MPPVHTAEKTPQGDQRRLDKRAQARPSDHAAHGLGAGTFAQSVHELQRAAGNQFTIAALQRRALSPQPSALAEDHVPSTPPPADELVVQRATKAKNRKKKAKSKARKKRAAARNRARETESKASESNGPDSQQRSGGGFFGSLASYLPGVFSYEASTDEDEEDEDEEEGAFEDVELEGGSEDDLELPGDKEETSALGEQLLRPFVPESITIEVGKAEGKLQGTRLGDVKGSAVTKQKADASNVTELKGSVKGGRGEASAEAKLVTKTESVEGEGKVEMLLGTKHEAKSGTLGWEMSGHKIQGDGELTHLKGLMASAEAKGKFDSATGDLVAAAKAGVFAGSKTEGTVKIKYIASGKDYGEVEGKLGLAWGLGGEIQGTVSWTGGVLTLGTSGMTAIGPGVSYSYKLSLNTTNIVQAAPGLLSRLWQWATTVPEGMTEEDFWV